MADRNTAGIHPAFRSIVGTPVELDEATRTFLSDRYVNDTRLEQADEVLRGQPDLQAAPAAAAEDRVEGQRPTETTDHTTTSPQAEPPSPSG